MHPHFLLSPLFLFSLSLSCFVSRFTISHKTEVVKTTLNPVWQAFKIPVRALCNGDYDRYVHAGMSQQPENVSVSLSHFGFINTLSQMSVLVDVCCGKRSVTGLTKLIQSVIQTSDTFIESPDCRNRMVIPLFS